MIDLAAIDLSTADKRCELIEHVTGLVLNGEIKSHVAGQVQRLCKEYREQADLRAMEIEIEQIKEMMTEVIRRKAGLSRDEVLELITHLPCYVRGSDAQD